MTKNSIAGEPNLCEMEKTVNFDEYPVDILETSSYFIEDISSMDELEQYADLVLKIKVADERITSLWATKSKVVIEEIYRGNENYNVGDEIYIYEPAAFREEISYRSVDGYQIMKTGEEYIVFIRHLETINNYQYKGDEADTYLPVSTKYSVYHADCMNTEGIAITPVHYVLY